MSQLSNNPTLQEVYTHVLLSLRKQGKPSRNMETGYCMYRSPENLACAVGQCIPDEHYAAWMEDTGRFVYMVKNPEFPQALNWMKQPLHFKLLNELQEAHDQIMFKRVYIGAGQPDTFTPNLHEWEVHMELIAKRHELEYLPLENSENNNESATV